MHGASTDVRKYGDSSSEEPPAKLRKRGLELRTAAPAASDRCVRTAFSVKIASAGCKQSEFTGKGREKPRFTFRCGTVKSFNTPYSLVGKVADKLMRIAFFISIGWASIAAPPAPVTASMTACGEGCFCFISARASLFSMRRKASAVFSAWPAAVSAAA